MSISIKKNNFKKSILKRWQLYVMLVPVILFYIFFVYRPLWGLQIAFKDYSVFKGLQGSEWAGLKHFELLFSNGEFPRKIWNTLIINVYGLIIGFPIPILLALLLNEVKHKLFKKTVQTITYLPHFISIVVIAGMVTNFLSPSTGIVNTIIAWLGFEKIYFLIDPKYFRGIFTGMNIWKNAGFGAIVYIAALSGIDQELYEAAKIDGASRLKQTLHVTLPGILPTITIMLILRIGAMLNVGFESIILLYQPATYSTADVISTYVYRLGLEEARYDFATAVGLFNSVVSLVLVSIANFTSKKLSDTSLW
ncbi:sugar ABC transporter permease [Vallitalea pronyensis]|uniref:Sugar ABC transporter permease n=1 Tax=Vallitalea pronyensis TaxID=1348613 RepID=A0A8J8MQ11_9FIRM|nr:ABC transporter permease subunit [Vallitalea pronyensis]QUI25293.1 sugar ABC transporter permease [Vallitalea pronyensis]